MKLHAPEPKQVVLLSLLAVLGLSWSWIFFIDATKITESSFVATLTAIVSFFLTVGVSIAIFYGGTRYLYREYKKQKAPSPLFLVKIFVVWAFLEWLVALAVGLLWAGKNSSLDTTVPFGSFTPVLMYTPIGLLARFFGYYGLSALFVTILTALSLKKYRRYGFYLVGVSIVLCLASWTVYKNPNGRPVDVLIVAEKLGEPQQISTDAELVVLPEYGLDATNTSNVQDRIIPMARNGASFVGSKQFASELGIQNVLVFGSTSEGFTKEQAKTRLVPAGEYLPYSVEFALRVTRQTGILAEFEFSRAVVRGNTPIEPFFVDGKLIVGAEACSSIISSEDYRKLTRKGATILTNSASLEIFNGSKVFNTQHKGMAKFMAVANARPMVQSAMDGPAFTMDHNGYVAKSVMPVATEKASVTTNTVRTPYTLLGEWSVYIGALLIIVLTIKKLALRYNNKLLYNKANAKNKKDS